MLQRCALVVAMLCISLPIVSIISLLTKAFFALRDYKTPTRIALVAVAVNLIANVILLQTPLQEAGLAVGTAISGALNLALLVLVLRGRLKGTIVDSMRLAASPQVSERLAQPLSPSALRSFPISLVRSVVVATAMGCVAYWVERAVFGAFDDHGRSVRALSVIAAIASGVAVYASASWMLRAPEVTQILSLRRRRTTTPPEVS
jgi:putative peptidoglycan lipid II flippase